MNASIIPAATSARDQRGVATLGVTVLLLVSIVLGMAFVNRNLVFEQRASANQLRSTIAFEAAQAGLEWAVAHLNDPARLDADCVPDSATGAMSFRDRLLVHDQASARFLPVTWSDAGVPMALRPTCVLDGTAWRCSCPVSGNPALSAPSGIEPAPAFVLQFDAVARPGLIRITATGCSALGGACSPSAAGGVDAKARIEALLALVPALRTAPAAAMTIRGSVGVDAIGLGAHNADPRSGGLAIHAGATIATPHANFSGPAGAATSNALIEQDVALADLDSVQFFAGYFGIGPSAWAGQPVVRQVVCASDCALTLTAASDSGHGAALLHVDGDAAITGPVTLGSPLRPVVIDVGGALELNGAVVVHGVVHAGSVRWNGGPGPGAMVRGALIVDGDYGGDASPQIVYAAEILTALKQNAGTFVLVPGSWRDF